MALHLLISAFHKLAFSGLLLYVGAAGLVPESSENTKNGNKAAAAATTAISPSSLKGIDVSKWQKEVDWPQVKEADVRFAFVKATQDDYRLDPYFARNWEETKRVGIKRGAYHFYIPAAPVQGQIDIFKSNVRLEPGDLPPVLDVEVINKGVSAEAMRRDIRIWLEAITQHYGVKPIIYTNQNYYRKWLQGHFQEYHFWIARYNTIEPEIHQTDKWLFWQYSDRGTIPGITAAVDMNFFAGDWDTLHALCMPELTASDDTALPWQEQMPPLQ